MNIEIEARISVLEKQASRQRWIMVVSGLCVVAILTMGADTDEVHEVLRAKKIEVVGGGGKVQVKLRATDDGGVVEIRNNSGERVVILFGTEHGGAVQTNKTDGSAAASLEVREHGGVVLTSS